MYRYLVIYIKITNGYIDYNLKRYWKLKEWCNLDTLLIGISMQYILYFIDNNKKIDKN